MAGSQANEEKLEPVYFRALDGNVKAAMEALNTIDPKGLNPTEQSTRQKYLDRFGPDAHPSHPKGPDLASELIGTYRFYWDQVLLQKLTQHDGYQFLFKSLVPIVRRLGGKADEFSEAEYDRIAEFLTLKLKDTGVNAKIGVVNPHMNLMAWQKQTSKPFTVDLGDGEVERVNVVLVEDFISLGWAAYATFDRYHVGGWVEENALYCLAPSYDLQSENFKVSFLAHEARHVRDKRKFKNLSSSDLEYRAKLNELILADQTFDRVIRKFLLEANNNPENPHSHASYRIAQALSKKLKRQVDLTTLHQIEKELIRKTARSLLSEDTKTKEAPPHRAQHEPRDARSASIPTY